MKIRCFIAGIIQGSKKNLDIHDQHYRDQIRSILETQDSDIEVYCPVQEHPNSVSYDDSQAREVFFTHLTRVRRSHILVVYLPEASLGSGIEMWEARQQNRLILTISPMTTNWIVRILSDVVFENLESFREFVESGALHRTLQERYSNLKESSP